MARFTRWPIISLILVAFVLLAILYSVATPIFEASDEVWHFPVVQYLKAAGQLPVQRPGTLTAWQQEGSQPPLYYALMALAISPIETSDLPDRLYANPHAAPGDPSLDANRNLIIHSHAEDFPWRDTTLAVHLIRFLSILMGAGTIILAYLIARRIFPDRPSFPIGTAALVAFNPMFIFISASVNNDNLTILLASLALYLSVLCWYEPAGDVDRSGWKRRLLLGIVLGGAALSKVSGLTLLPIAALILTVRHLRGRDWRGWILSGVVITLPVLLIAGWWYARNLQLYGELFGLDTMVAIAGPRSTSLLDLVPEFDGFRYSYWALFGAVNIVTFPIVYLVFDLFTVVSVAGAVIWFIRNRRDERFILLLILAAYVLLIFAGVVRWTMMTPASQGRLMYPAISAISLLLWLGWESIFKIQLPLNRGGRLRWAMPIFMLLAAAVVPFHAIAPAYAGPQMMSERQLPSDLNRLEVDYGDQLRLIGYHVTEPLAPSGSAEFTLYWQCLKLIKADYSVVVILYGRQLQEAGKRDAYPYHGLYATRQCQPGQIFADPYQIPIKQDAVSPTVLRAQIGLRDLANKVELPPTANGTLLAAVVFPAGRLGASAEAALKPQFERHYRFGDAIELVGYDAPQVEPAQGLLRYRLYWRVLSTPAEDYTLFAHILDENGKLIGQADSPPFEGDYPTTWWRAGEEFVEERSIPLPKRLSGGQVVIGLYRPLDGLRLEVKDMAGQMLPDGQVSLGLNHGG